MIKWHTEKRKIAELKEWEDNPRKPISDKEYENLKKSITKRGFHDILKIDENNVVLSGNQRLKALKELGYTEVECKVSDKVLTQDQKDAVALESNTHGGEWDMDKLADGFGDVMEEIGFGDLMPTTLDGLGDDFSLKDGEREPFRQMTFTFADEQATEIEEAIRNVKQTDEYRVMDMFGNENTNGNAIFTIIKLWQEQKILK